MKQWSKIMSLALSALFISSTMMVGAASNIPGGPATEEVGASTSMPAASVASAPVVSSEDDDTDIFEALMQLARIKKDIASLKTSFITPKAGGKTVTQEFKEQVAAFNAIDSKNADAKTRALMRLLLVVFAPLQKMTNVTAGSSKLIDTSIKGIASATGFETQMKNITSGTDNLAQLTKTANELVKSLNKALLQTYDSIRDADAIKQGKAAPTHVGSDTPIEAVDLANVEVDLSGF